MNVPFGVSSFQPMKPGSCTLPLHGIDLAVLDPMTGAVIEGKLNMILLFVYINGLRGLLIPFCGTQHDRLKRQ